MTRCSLAVFVCWLAAAGVAVAQTPSAPSPALAGDDPSCALECAPTCPVTAPCGPLGRFWFEADYLLWGTKGENLPPLITASPAGTPRTEAGVLGQPGTTVIFGGDHYDDGLRSGYRLDGGFWLNCEQTCGIELDYFNLGRTGNNALAGDAGGPGAIAIARPFFNASTGAQDAELVAYPGVLSGQVAALSSTSLQGADANLRKNLCCGCCYRLDMLAGYRYLDLHDNIDIYENLTNLSAANGVPVGTNILVHDHFRTDNYFNGGQIGFDGEVRRGCFSLGLRVLAAIGATQQIAEIDGSTTVNVPGAAPVSNVGGLLAQRTNIGRYTQTEFSFVPQVGLTLGYQITPHIRATVGYDFLYWSSVARAGDQIDTTVNSTQIPPGTLVGAARPAFSFQNTDFWAQGISAGLQFRY